MNNQSWRNKVQELFQVCQDELKRTTEIGKKMLSASKTNSHLHDAYQELGELTAQSIKDGSLEWKHPQVKKLLKEIERDEKNLEAIEQEVSKVRFSAREAANKKTPSRGRKKSDPPANV